MNFDDEDYVRVYTRDTPNWVKLGWEGQSVLLLMMRKVGRRSGAIELDGLEPAEALASVIGMPVKVVRVGLEKLLERGTATIAGGMIVLPKFLSAQWARRSDAARKRDSRASQSAREEVTDRILAEIEGSVTNGHTGAPSVTSPNPSQSNPNQEDPPVVPLAGDDALRVFEAWKSLTKHPNARFDRKRKKRIESRLREGFTPEQLSTAIKNARNDPFLMGENEHGRVYDGIETLLRDAGQVERLIGLSRPRNGASSTPAHQPFPEEKPVPPEERVTYREIQASMTAGIGRR